MIEYDRISFWIEYDRMVYRVFRRSQFPWLKKLGTDGHTIFLVVSSWNIFGAICGNLNF